MAGLMMIFARFGSSIFFLAETQLLARPVLLLLDGHQCHFTAKVIEAAKQNNIIILCLPPHTTHGLQPLDLVTFG
jgi:hypothetical protein